MKNIITKLSLLLLILFSLSCGLENNEADIVILYTNDEHGWLEPNDEYDGAPGLSGLWKSKEGYNGSDSYLILSGGDMWTGPAISTWFKGESMVEVMNEMGYDAVAIGNHEFDFTVDVLNQRLQQMDFPLLSANIIEKKTGNIPSFAQPYIIIESNGVNVGIIGLSSLSTPYSTFPAYVEDYEFTSYSEAVDKYATTAKDEGAEVIIIIGHICDNEMEALVPTAKAHGIPLITGGHCHQIVARESDGVILIEAGSNMRYYAKIELQYDKKTKSVKINSYSIENNQEGCSDNKVQSIVESWQARVKEALSDVIGYCSENIEKSSVEMGNMVTDSWFYTFPDADISITNSGGIRQDIIAGEISLETIVGLLPFNNTILELDLTGTELINCIGYYLLGGMTTINGYFLSDGTPIYDDSVYSVLTTDYLYSVSSNNFSQYDPDPVNTSVHYRQPLIDWIISKNTSTQNPLNNYLDYTPRR